MTNITVSVDLQVDDEVEFRKAAHDRAIADGLLAEEAARYLDDEETSLSECAQMLIDLGLSPGGCSILGSSADESESLILLDESAKPLSFIHQG